MQWQTTCLLSSPIYQMPLSSSPLASLYLSMLLALLVSGLIGFSVSHWRCHLQWCLEKDFRHHSKPQLNIYDSCEHGLTNVMRELTTWESARCRVTHGHQEMPLWSCNVAAVVDDGLLWIKYTKFVTMPFNALQQLLNLNTSLALAKFCNESIHCIVRVPYSPMQ